MSSKTTKSRYLLLREVADFLGLKLEGKQARVQYVRRLFRKLEKRDRTTYLHKFGPKNSPLKVCADDLSQLDPWEPTTAQELRDKVDNLKGEAIELKLRIERLERFATDTQNYFKRKTV